MNKKRVIKKTNPLFLKGICHRGLHNEQFTENGLKAFKNAIDHNMAFELDVHLSKDNHLIVSHDSKLERTTGKQGNIEELTLKEIKDNYRLHDGGEVPTLQEVLELCNERVPICIEIKVVKDNYKEISKQLVKELKNIKDKKNYFLISFDPRSLWKARKTHIVNGLLVTPAEEWTFKGRALLNSVDIDIKMIDQKRVQNYHKRHFLNVWTVESKEDFDKVYPYVDTVTFQHMDEQYVIEKLTEKNQKYLEK